MKFNRNIKQALSWIVVSSLLFGNVGYSVKNNDKSNLIKNSSKKSNDYIINSKDKQSLKKILIPTLGVAIPTALVLTCWWLLGGSDDSGDGQPSGGNPNGSPKTEQPKPARETLVSQPLPPKPIEESSIPQPDTKNENPTDIKTIIDESNEKFNNNENSTTGVNADIVSFYSKCFNNLGQIITRYFSLVNWSRNNEQVGKFQSGELSKWFIGAVNEYFITKHGYGDDAPQKNTKLIKDELTALYNEKDAQKVVEIARGIIAKIFIKVFDDNNPLLTENLIKYYLSVLDPDKNIPAKDFPGSDAYMKKWNGVLDELKKIDFIESWNNIDTYCSGNEDILEILEDIYGELVQNSQINDLTNDVNDYNNNMNILSINQRSIYYDALYNILYMKKYATENRKFLVSNFNSIRSDLIKIAKERLREQLATHIDFESFRKFNDIDGYLNSVAEKVIQVKHR